MEPRHLRHWPAHLPRSLPAARTTLQGMLEDTARRFPDKPAVIFRGETVTWGEIARRVLRLAGHLRHGCGVRAGDRVLLDAQNGTDFVVACLAILRADAVVVPVSPMCLSGELKTYLEDSEARVALVERELASRFEGSLLEHLVVIEEAPGESPDPGPSAARPGDLCLMPYTSGSTGRPKGCMHTHATVLHNVVGSALWKNVSAETVALATAPFFHVTGLIHSFLATLWAGGTIVVQRRWDPVAAAELVERHRCTHWDNVPTMVVDLLSSEAALGHDISSLKWIFGGGAAMPEAIAQKLFELCGVHYIEGYGMTEAISQTHINPPHNPKKQCLGIPTFDTEARVVDPDSFEIRPPGEAGEIVVRGPQLLAGYWKNERSYRESWVTIEGKAYFRTGDLGRMDEDGYFFISDRLKRMINAAGFKVWPAEVEAAMYRHPAIRECCVIAAPDARRGETVKAVVALKPGARATAGEIIAWARGEMAAYKVPRQVAFVDALPRSGSGKIQWRALQEEEFASAGR